MTSGEQKQQQQPSGAAESGNEKVPAKGQPAAAAQGSVWRYEQLVPRSNRGMYLLLLAAAVGAGTCKALNVGMDITLKEHSARFGIGLLSLLWAGMVLGISFLESWVKFKAQLATKSIGLDIGRNVFFALNTVEILMNFVCVSLFIFSSSSFHTLLEKERCVVHKLLIISACVLVQSLYIQPKLDERARRIISNTIEYNMSSIHHFYVIVECIKLITLILLGSKIFA